jgi:hypothetical protein
MKSVLAFLSLLTFGFNSTANPIALPTLLISELYFDNSGKWHLELEYSEISPPGFAFDSVFLYSATDKVKLHSYEFSNLSGVLVITPDSLDSGFNIHRYGDTIKVEFFINDYPFEHYLIFGDVTDAIINYPFPGQSISKYGHYFVKDNSPTIGFPNDESGIYGTLTGTIFDKYSVPVANRELYLVNKFVTSENGGYSASVFAKPSDFNQVYYRIDVSATKYVAIEPISFIMEPDSIVFRDIHLLDPLSSGFENQPDIQNPIKIYPNPVSKLEKLYYEIDLPVKSTNIRLDVLSADGKLVKSVKVSEKSGEIELTGGAGLYFVTVRISNKQVSANRIICRE